MTEQEAKIKDLELRTDKIEDRLKRLEDRMFDTWIAQYDNCVKDLNPAVLYPDVSTKPFDPNEVPDVFSVCKPHNDEYIGGPVAGYCPDYMKGDK